MQWLHVIQGPRSKASWVARLSCIFLSRNETHMRLCEDEVCKTTVMGCPVVLGISRDSYLPDVMRSAPVPTCARVARIVWEAKRAADCRRKSESNRGKRQQRHEVCLLQSSQVSCRSNHSIHPKNFKSLSFGRDFSGEGQFIRMLLANVGVFRASPAKKVSIFWNFQLWSLRLIMEAGAGKATLTR